MSNKEFDNINIPKNIDDVIEKGVNKAVKEQKLKNSKKRKVRNIAASVACVLVIGTIGINGEKVDAIIKGTIQFFNSNNDLKYGTDREVIEKFNKAVGVSAENNGIKLTIDNIAVDDNYLNVFYTVESEKPFDKKDNMPYQADFILPFMDYKINDESIEVGNHNINDAYFESDKVLKGMSRINMSVIDIPDEFKLSIEAPYINDVKGNWNIETLVNKVSDDTITVIPNINAKFNVNDDKYNVTIDKVSISPFGSQLVLSGYRKDGGLFSTFALYDDKGNSLDVLPTDTSGSEYGKIKNSFEFLKANKDMEYITLVPIEYPMRSNLTQDDIIIKDITNEPTRFDICSEGSIIVDKVEAEGKVIKITYRKDGLTDGETVFSFYDKDGNEVGEKEKGFKDYSVDRESGTYVETFEFYNDTVDTSKVAKLGIYPKKFSVLRDQGVKIKLK